MRILAVSRLMGSQTHSGYLGQAEIIECQSSMGFIFSQLVHSAYMPRRLLQCCDTLMEYRHSERPAFSPSEVQEILRSRYGLSGSFQELPSERDQNYHLVTDSGEEYVLKIASESEKKSTLLLQNAALHHLAKSNFNAPQVRKTLSGLEIEAVESRHGTSHLIRLITYLPGSVLAKVSPHSESLLFDLGRFLGTLTRAFLGFDHEGAHRQFYWDLNQASNVLYEYSPLIRDASLRDLVEYFIELHETIVAPKLDELRSSVIHNDANDYNIVIDCPHHDESRSFGLLDFGDMVFSHTVNELAVGIAYSILDKPDPLGAAQKVIAGYHSVMPLTELEIHLLFSLVCTRLAMSVSIAAYQQGLEPENEYLGISQNQVRRTLRLLREIHPRFAEYCFRSAIGVEPCAKTKPVLQWLKKNSRHLGSLLASPFNAHNCTVLDLSVGSLDIETPFLLTDHQSFGTLISSRLKSAGVSIGIGRYNEPRLLYQGDQYISFGNEKRTIHLATDVFVECGTPVFAVYDGRVHSFHDNDKPLDNGPTIVIEHFTSSDTPPFYVLYGHLARDSLKGLSVGMQVKKGQQIGNVGSYPENGGWPPHLHFQLIVDMMDREGDFFGVAPASTRNVWLSICPDPNVILHVPESLFPPAQLSLEEIQYRRQAHLSKSLSTSYKRPLTIVRGYMQYLYDENGREYLDVRNNVPQVGHSNHDVVRALSQQASVLNTNTRYLNEGLVKYAERLCSTLPDPLRVCFFVNSGSEANELALRLAQTHTRHKDIIAIDGAYHGNTSRLIDISSYKHNGPGGEGTPSNVHIVRMPDVYRGEFRGLDAGKRYADDVRRAVENVSSQGKNVAAFICEPLMGCGGQIVFPHGYLRNAFRYIRNSGGVCIVDEVQTGFGRVGTHFWGFETQEVIPDIVTMGKSIGNGHPIGAVVTTPEIAESFNTGMEFFSTTGGNTVSCAVGMAVLDIIENQQLQKNALDVGNHLLKRLNALKERYPIIGNVRGIGLFIGVELVRNHSTLEPASHETEYIVERMKDLGVLISLDGPLNNVLKIKPPLVFTIEDADRLVSVLESVLSEDPARVG
jgi:4-aminobutyrate aminotransferase-like enzyme/Ser/Thr protein kinase RdoA (MazF antagonist)